MTLIINKIARVFSRIDADLDAFEPGRIRDKGEVSAQALMRTFNLAAIQGEGTLALEPPPRRGCIRIGFGPRKLRCPHCGAHKLDRNGYNDYDRRGGILNEIGIRAVLSKYRCGRCGATDISVTPDDILPVLNDIEKLIDKTIVTLRENGVSFGRIAQAIDLEFGVKVHESTVARHYKKLRGEVLENAPPVPEGPPSGYYSYDEQVLKRNGKEVFRLTLVDAVTRRLIAEERGERVTKDAVRGFLDAHVDRERVKAFVVDGRTIYSSVIHLLFGKRVGIQQCIVHVMRRTSKDYAAHFHNKTLGTRIPFRELYWKEVLFDVFFPRPEILEFLGKLRYKENHGDLSEEEARDARKRFYELVEKHRRIASDLLEGYTLDEARRRFDVVLRNIERYPVEVQGRIKTIQENWKDYTLYLVDRNVPPTNNVVEQYYARTAQKTRKKRFRSDDSIDAFVTMNRKLKERPLLDFINPSVSAITIALLFSRLAALISF